MLGGGEVISIYPTADRLCRNGSKTTWTTVSGTQTPVDPSETFTTFELKYQAKLYAILQFEVPNFKAVKTMSFIFTKDDVANQATLMGVWNYSGYDMPQNNGTSATYTYQKVTAVIGVEPGETTKDSEVIEPLAQGDNKDGVWTFAIDANTIAPTVVYKEDGTTAVVQLLLTTYAPSRNSASKIFAYNIDQTKTPHLDVEYVDYSKPVQEICYRLNGNNDGWNSGSYPMHAASTNDFEITHSSGLCAVYQYWLEDFDKSMNYTFTITTRNQETNVYAWEFPYALPQKNSDPAAEFAANVATVTGVALGTAKDAGTYNNSYLAISARKDGVATFTIKGSDLKNVVTDARGNKIVTLLLTSQLGGNYKYYNSLSDIADAKKPSWNVSYINVYNETQDLTYDDLPAACTGAVDGDVIRVNNDVTLTARLGVEKAITIKGRTPQTKILRGTDLNNLLILAQNKEVTLKDITLDGQSVSREKDGIECGTNSKLTLDNVTMQNFVPTNGKADVCVNGNGVILTNTNILPNGIRLNKKKRVQTTNATHTEPILLLLAGDYEEEYAIVLTCSDPTLFTAKDANGYYWSLHSTMSGSNHELKGNKAPWQYDLTVSSAKMATLVLGFDATIPAGVTAYQLTNDGSEVIEATPINSIVKNEPVLITAEEGVYRFIDTKTVALDEQPNPTSGCLKGSYSLINVPASTNGTYNYILARDEEGVGFYQVADASCTIAKNRAYLSCSYNSQSVGGSKAPLRIKINGKAPTYLENTNTSDVPQKVMSNGQILIHRSGRHYRLDGQEVK